MGSTMFVDTTLDLNLNPLHHGEKVPMRELNGAYPEFERKPPVAEEAGVLVEELHRMTSENKRLTEMLTTVCENYHALQKRFVEMIGKKKDQIATSRKRKADTDQDCCNMIGFNNCQAESSSSEEDQSCKRPKEHNVKAPVSRVYVRVDASNPSLVVKDGYQWRKYGQKVTRDNPSPRAYFKCSFAPSCPVKKKVQRSAEDPSILVATYEGEHNHSHPSQANLSLSPSHGAALGRVPVSCSMMTSSAATVTLDLIQPAGVSRNYIGSVQENDQLPAIQQILVEQMASSLTRDPNFTATLAAAISGRFLDKTRIHDPQN